MADCQDKCSHETLSCLNEYDFIRKYRCKDCGAVMMCDCDKTVGRAFLPHQLKVGSEYGTRIRVRVTAGFQPRICRDCRGLPPEPHPRAEIHGQTTKIKRYYWREIWRRRYEFFLDWAREHGQDPKSAREPSGQPAWEEAEARALAEIKELHEKSPRYVYGEESEEEFIRRCGVNVLALAATYARKSETKRVQVFDGQERISVEEYVMRYFARDRWQSVVLESRPLHALFAVLMCRLVQDPSDEEVQTVGRKACSNVDAKESGPVLWFPHPKDFGSAAYGVRRTDAIRAHLSQEMFDRTTLLQLFDRWTSESWTLRNYLWVHKEEDVHDARRLVELLPPTVIVDILRYLAENYWHHCLGWPDLLLWRPGEFLLVEVKSSGDKLSEDQKRWISDNFARLHLPFQIAKLHKTALAD